MLSVEEARERILAAVTVLEREEAPLLSALGHTLATDIVAEEAIPAFPNSSMDGYAVRAADISAATVDRPMHLTVVGEAPAGHPTEKVVRKGEAIRILTGGQLPGGADTVVQRELTRLDGNAVLILEPLPQYCNVRPAGEDVRQGELVLRQGSVLRPQELGVLATLGYATAPVTRQPRVAVLSTGDELVEPGEPMGPGQIRNSNTYTVAALVEKYGGVPQVLGIARDTHEAIETKLRLALSCDLILTSGGVSMGAEYDVVKEFFAKKGEVEFWQVNMQPGKPMAFGRLGPSLLIGLPGNPVSSMVSFEQFVRPAMLRLLGRRALNKQMIRAALLDGFSKSGSRRFYARAHVEWRDGVWVATTTGPQGSGILTSMTRANALAVIPEEERVIRPGDLVNVLMLDWPEVE